MTLDPCACIGVTSNPAPTPTPTPVDCLKLCHITVNASSDDAVGPCGQEGSIDVMGSPYGDSHDITVCGANPLTWSVHSFSDELVSVNITTAGVLTWVTGSGIYAGKYGTVWLKACCGDNSKFIQVLIGIKDLCNCPTCPECENCDPCTGDCLDGGMDISVSGTNE